MDHKSFYSLARNAGLVPENKEKEGRKKRKKLTPKAPDAPPFSLGQKGATLPWGPPRTRPIGDIPFFFAVFLQATAPRNCRFALFLCCVYANVDWAFPKKTPWPYTRLANQTVTTIGYKKQARADPVCFCNQTSPHLNPLAPPRQRDAL
nr:hypothetical protein [Pandoravirus massiliensis]